MNWFERHLNWTFILVSWGVPIALAVIQGLLEYSIDIDPAVIPVIDILYWLVSLAALFGGGAWALKKKARSLWHLLWLIVPFGIIVFLCLENRSEQSYEPKGEQELSEQELTESEEKLTRSSIMTRKHVLIAAIFLLIGTALGSFAGFIYYAPKLQSSKLQVSNLTLQVTNLTSQVATLQQTVTSQGTRIASLESDYESLESNYYLLDGQFKSLQSDHRILQTEYRDLEALVYLYESVPHSYYSTDAFEPYSNTWEELNEFLLYEFRLPARYKEDVFDCSEASAYLEWALETAGFDADIVTGPTPSDPTSGYHAWVMVHCEGERVAIEATWLTGKHYLGFVWWERIPGVIYGNDRFIDFWQNYYDGYDKTYRNIYYAIRSDRATWEWDWWVEFWELG